ncbi:DnaJ like protein subfamily C member 10 [Fukomys damarensis]|uniref:DnaJ homolog subfamily C member 10 n=1 Tax=Fukomys damarensis TaxID=885580 RepID=A0A091DYN0_FUKDA|nr:DnaJ like protein subfamily C member 10 [Fukomys damarensis]
MLKVKTRVPLLRTAVIPGDSEDRSSSNPREQPSSPQAHLPQQASPRRSTASHFPLKFFLCVHIQNHADSVWLAFQVDHYLVHYTSNKCTSVDIDGPQGWAPEIPQCWHQWKIGAHRPNNPNAHGDFLKINRAYEVLKDEDLRKKYDKYGEKGLEDNQGGQYESWNYYRYDFGKWREFAKEVDGLLRIGAVNCGDDRMLCRMKGVNSYPSLFIFRSGMFLNSLDAKEIYWEIIHKLPDFELLSAKTLEDRLAHHRWLIFFSFGKNENSNDPELKKLKTLLKNDHIQVGRFDCSSAPSTCRDLYVFQPCLAVFKGQGTKEYEIHHGKKILYDILAFAKESVNSHVTTLGPQNFPSSDKEPWLVDFFAPWCPPCRALLPELRKASTILYGQLKFGTLDCTVHEGLCNMYNIQAYPTTVVFNQSSIHEYEGHHSAEQILEFIEDLRNPSVVSLTPTTFTELVKQRKHDEVWMVDFYSPWCHPCQVLLPEWKRMARTLTGLINVGSVDCQQYHSFCAQENVQRYPEIRFYPQKSNKGYQYHSYNGWNRDAYSLRIWGLGFLPQVSTDLTPQTFSEKVLQGKNHWVVDFYAPWCGPCQNFAPEFELLARMVKGKVKAGKVDCQAHSHTCQKAGIQAYPTVRFYAYDRTKKSIWEEHISARDAKTIAASIYGKLETLQNQEKRNKVRTKPKTYFGKSYRKMCSLCITC